jgi:Rad3-related DNA helicase
MASTFGQAPVLPESSNELFRTLCRYVVVNELYGDYHRCITSRDRTGQRRQVSIDLYCLDASLALSRQYRHFKSVIVFSASLRPCVFYRDALGLPESTRKLQLASPFDPARVDYSIVDWIDTRYRQRESSLPALVDLIYQACALKEGKYLVFFPSYAYLDKACTAFCSAHPDVDVWKQSSDMSRQQQQAVLACLDETGHRIGFAILGGIFGEGIDYAGDRLIGVIVVSPGLPSLDRQTQLVADHYRQQGHDGYDFAYRFPGFTRVLQTVGRLIRTESDGGMVLLVDDRFRLTTYKTLYPSHWKVGQPSDQTALLNCLKTFWTSLSLHAGSTG